MQTQISRLLGIMEQLRSPGGCPWDGEQTPESLKPYIIEEAYEVVEAVEQAEPGAICDELGDLLLQVVFQARIFEERGLFGFEDVAGAICDKLIRRHPHVFGDLDIKSSEELRANWERIKQQEKAASPAAASAASSVPRALPALSRAAKTLSLLQKSGRPFAAQPSKETLEQLARLRSTLDKKTALARMLLCLCALAREMDIDAEDCLQQQLNELLASLDEQPAQEN